MRTLDEILLEVLRIQPSEIDALNEDDYFFWVEAADRKIKRQLRAAGK